MCITSPPPPHPHSGGLTGLSGGFWTGPSRGAQSAVRLRSIWRRLPATAAGAWRTGRPGWGSWWAGGSPQRPGGRAGRGAHRLSSSWSCLCRRKGPQPVPARRSHPSGPFVTPGKLGSAAGLAPLTPSNRATSEVQGVACFLNCPHLHLWTPSRSVPPHLPSPQFFFPSPTPRTSQPDGPACYT